MLRYKSFSISSFMFPFSTGWACLAVRNGGLKRLFDRNILGIDCSKRFSHRPERAKHVSFIFLTTFTKVLSISWFSPGFANSPDLLLIFSPSFKKNLRWRKVLKFHLHYSWKVHQIFTNFPNFTWSPGFEFSPNVKEFTWFSPGLCLQLHRQMI